MTRIIYIVQRNISTPVILQPYTVKMSIHTEMLKLVTDHMTLIHYKVTHPAVEHWKEYGSHFEIYFTSKLSYIDLESKAVEEIKKSLYHWEGM